MSSIAVHETPTVTQPDESEPRDASEVGFRPDQYTPMEVPPAFMQSSRREAVSEFLACQYGQMGD